MKPFTIAGYIVMAAAGLSVLNVFVLGLLQRRRERTVLRAVGVTCGQEQAVIITYAVLLGLLVAMVGGLGGIGVTYLCSLGSPVYYGIKLDWAVLAVATTHGGDGGDGAGSGRRGVPGALHASAGSRGCPENRLS